MSAFIELLAFFNTLKQRSRIERDLDDCSDIRIMQSRNWITCFRQKQSACARIIGRNSRIVLGIKISYVRYAHVCVFHFGHLVIGDICIKQVDVCGLMACGLLPNDDELLVLIRSLLDFSPFLLKPNAIKSSGTRYATWILTDIESVSQIYNNCP